MSLVAVNSPHSVPVTMDLLLAALERRGITVFARIDHGGGARAAGLELADEELVIFGDPRAGTPLMQANPEIGYELPCACSLGGMPTGPHKSATGHLSRSQRATRGPIKPRSSTAWTGFFKT